MSRLEQFESRSEVAPVVETDADETLMRLWLLAGSWAQMLTILGFMATLCGILYYHL